MFNIDINDEKEVNSVLPALSNTTLPNFVKMMLETRNMHVCNKIAYALHNYDDPIILDALIQIIQRKEREGKRAKLIMLCERYDCSKYLDLFVYLARTENSEAYLWACDVIGNMQGPFVMDRLQANMQLLQKDISMANDEEKAMNLRKVQAFLRKWL